MIDTEKYRLALQDAFGFPFADPPDSPHTLLYDGNQRVQIQFDPEHGTATVVTPVDEVHDGLPAIALKQLLARNLPNKETAGAVLQVGDNGSHVDLVNVLPLAAIEPRAFTGIVVAQAAGAKSLSQWALAEVKRILADTAGASR